MNKYQEARQYLDELQEKLRSYEGGDRPPSPPVKLLRELESARAAIARMCKNCNGSGRTGCDRDGNECQSRVCRACATCNETGLTIV